MKESKVQPEKENLDRQMRKKAEAKLAGIKPSPGPKEITSDDLIHELQVHQIELEMQNDELKVAQLDLEEINNKYIDLYDFAPVGYFTLNRFGLIREVNLTGAALLGLARHELINRGFGRFVAPSAVKMWDGHIVSVLQQRDKQSCELELKRVDGSRQYVRLNSIRMETVDEPQIRTAISDITELKKLEDERIQLLVREQAARAEADAARDLTRLKSIFMASISHELRTPLNSIIGFTGVLLEGWSGELNPDQKEQLGMVRSSARHLLTIIAEILNISMIESGTKYAQVSEFDLRQVVEEAVSMHRVSMDKKGLGLSYVIEKITMKSDRKCLLQCICKLLDNAVKFTEKGNINISAKIRKNKVDMVDISVTDTGIGIKTEDIQKLFVPFARLDSSMAMLTTGTGLGLYLTRKLARDVLCGDVDVKSESGKGSTFTLHVPVDV